MHTREFILQGLSDSSWVWFSVIVCAIATVLIVTLMKYERRLVAPRVGNTLLVLRLSVLAVMLLTFLQPVVTWTLDQDRSGRIVVAVDASASMDTTDTYASRAELLRWARALELIGNDATNERLDRWIVAYERNEEPPWVDASEAASASQRDELTKLRQANVQQVITTVRDMPRREMVRRLLTARSESLIKQLGDVGQVDLVAFAGTVQTLDVTTLDAVLQEPSASLQTDHSNLNGPTEARGADQQTALIGAVVFTDGRHNSGRDPLESARRMGTLNTPLIPVMIGSERRPRDISVVAVDAPQTAFRNDTPVVKARLAADGFRDEELAVILTRPDGTEDTQTVRVPSEAVGAPFVDVEFPLSAEELGRQEYQIRTAVREGEIRDDNNQRSFAIEVVDDKAHVLLLDGEARWEFRFLDNAFERDDRVELSHVVFEQPYMRLLPETFFPNRLALPQKVEDVETSGLTNFDLMIVGDVTTRHITPNDWLMIESFVRDHGGTLVMTAGKNEFPGAHLHPGNPAFDRLLPVRALREIDIADGSGALPPADRGFRLQLTPDALNQAMFQFDTDSIENRNIWSRLPGHLWGLAADARVGSTVLATAERLNEPGLQAERSDAMIVHQYYGFGQLLWIGIDSTWRWRHRIGDKYHHRFWGQMARWAARNKAAAGNDHVRLSLSASQLQPGDEATVQTRWHSRFMELNPELKASIHVFREPDDGTGQPFATIDLNAVDGQPLLREGRLTGLPSGTWRLKLVVENADVGDDITTSVYVSDAVTGELAELSANRELLARMAEVSGGTLLLPDQLDQIPALLSPPDDSAESREETTLWDHWLILTLFFALLTTEWVVRKLNGLP